MKASQLLNLITEAIALEGDHDIRVYDDDGNVIEPEHLEVESRVVRGNTIEFFVFSE